MSDMDSNHICLTLIIIHILLKPLLIRITQTGMD